MGNDSIGRATFDHLMMHIDRRIWIYFVLLSLSLPLSGAPFEKGQGHYKTWLKLGHLGTLRVRFWPVRVTFCKGWINPPVFAENRVPCMTVPAEGTSLFFQGLGQEALPRDLPPGKCVHLVWVIKEYFIHSEPGVSCVTITEVEVLGFHSITAVLSI